MAKAAYAGDWRFQIVQFFELHFLSIMRWARKSVAQLYFKANAIFRDSFDSYF